MKGKKETSWLKKIEKQAEDKSDKLLRMKQREYK